MKSHIRRCPVRMGMAQRVCNYCLDEAEVLNVVGFMYRIPICYCDKCRDRFYKEGNKMGLGSEYAVVGFGDGYDVPILLGVENIQTQEQGVDVIMEDWLKKEKERIETERARILKEKGYDELFRFPVGETKVTLVMEQPKLSEGTSGKKFAVFKIIVDEKEVHTGVNLTSPVYREFISRMAEGKLEFVMVRTGTGLDTRYSFK